MRCRDCGERWSLTCGLGPGGSASPGQFFAVGIAVIAIALVVGWLWSWLAGGLLGFVGALVLSMSISGCGYPEPATAYQGCVCPSCGKRNRVWPWNS